MKTVILAGGLGTRLAEETETKPKPMVEIGDRPILWHIMKHYSYYGFHEFILPLGYKGDVIRRYFLDYSKLGGSLSINLKTGEVDSGTPGPSEPWHIRLVETGSATNTGGRILRLKSYLQDGTFFLTYGDGVSNVNFQQLLAFHRSHGCLATVSAVHPPARFGALQLDGDRVAVFTEKSPLLEGWINGGFFAFEPGILDYLHGDDDNLEHDVLQRLAADGQLRAFLHEDFWQCMDTLRDVRLLQSLWQSDSAPWKLWE
jgi:glucose-1-phosphate cytidylyltransferase